MYLSEELHTSRYSLSTMESISSGLVRQPYMRLKTLHMLSTCVCYIA